MNDLIRLFGTKTIGDWKAVRQKIIDNPNEIDNWKEATNLLDDRLNTRYFQPISRILNLPLQDKEESLCDFVDKILSEFGLLSSPVTEERVIMALSGEGFAAMTLICSLIEFLQSCYEGRKYKNETDVNKLNLNFEYSFSGAIFKRFLECHEPFRPIFSEEVLNPKDKIKTFADDFYYSVRCGLLHEAATNNDWIIKQKHSRNFVDVENATKKIIFRDNFYESIKQYFEEYKQKIIDNKQETIKIRDQDKNIYLRQAFCRKIDFLCGMDESVKPVNNRSGDWWDETKIYI